MKVYTNKLPHIKLTSIKYLKQINLEEKFMRIPSSKKISIKTSSVSPKLKKCKLFGKGIKLSHKPNSTDTSRF